MKRTERIRDNSLKRQARIWNFLDVVDNGLFRLLTKTKCLPPQKETLREMKGWVIVAVLSEGDGGGGASIVL